MRYIECDRCGCTYKNGSMDTRHIQPVYLKRDGQEDSVKDLCDECYREVKKVMNKKLPRIAK